MEVGKVYHVYNRGNNRQALFFEEDNYIFFLKQLNKYLIPKVDMLAYCLMPNHFHLLIRIKSIAGMLDDEIQKDIAKSFRNFLISYAKAINKKYHRSGALFQQKFKRKEVDNNFYFSWLIQYIHMNPVKAALCKDPASWRYSSYNAFVSNKLTRICVNEIIEWFGSREDFIRIHKERVIDEDQLKRYLFDDD